MYIKHNFLIQGGSSSVFDDVLGGEGKFYEGMSNIIDKFEDDINSLSKFNNKVYFSSYEDGDVLAKTGADAYVFYGLFLTQNDIVEMSKSIIGQYPNAILVNIPNPSLMSGSSLANIVSDAINKVYRRSFTKKSPHEHILYYISLLDESSDLDLESHTSPDYIATLSTLLKYCNDYYIVNEYSIEVEQLGDGRNYSVKTMNSPAHLDLETLAMMSSLTISEHPLVMNMHRFIERFGNSISNTIDVSSINESIDMLNGLSIRTKESQILDGMNMRFIKSGLVEVSGRYEEFDVSFKRNLDDKMKFTYLVEIFDELVTVDVYQTSGIRHIDTLNLKPAGLKRKTLFVFKSSKGDFNVVDDSLMEALEKFANIYK